MLTSESTVIKKCCKNLPSGIEPTNYISKLQPIDFGRYIAIKYVNMKSNIIYKIDGNKSEFIPVIQNNDIRKTLISYINKLNRFIPIIPIIPIDGKDYNNQIYFHIILYCMWWTANNDDGIKKYYEGINEVFDMINDIRKSDIPKYDKIDLVNPTINSKFESKLIELTKEDFIIFNQQWSQNFCDDSKDNTYPDCGEVTARNLINLLCFNGDNFDINILEKFEPIPKLIDYYKKFNTFAAQSYVYVLDGTSLNARDEWSKLIIENATYNINFKRTCKNNEDEFELTSGLAKDKTTSNFFQLIKNLLGIKYWEDLIVDGIDSIDSIDNYINEYGIGNLNISHKDLGEFIIHCQEGHYYMEHDNKKNKEIYYGDLDKYQQGIIDKLLRKNITDYLMVKFDSDFIESTIMDPPFSTLLLPLLLLSITDQFDSDLRRRIKINIESEYVNEFLNICKDNVKVSNKLQEYSYLSYNFDIYKNEIFAKLKIKVNINTNVSNIDLSPLDDIELIDNNFLSRCTYLTSINLSPLSNVTEIGINFLESCIGLTSINLSPLSKVTKIGYGFLRNCANLTSIDLSPLSNVTVIHSSFLKDCTRLTSINLSPLSKVTEIGINFLESCIGLTSINLSPLSKVTKIGYGFLSRCTGLTSIILSPLSEVTEIDGFFLNNCTSLTSINLSPLSKVTKIGYGFLRQCHGLTSINLSPLSNVTEIGSEFLWYCYNLTSVDFPKLSKITKIGNEFLIFCVALTSIDLSQLPNVTTIGNYFLWGCKGLTSIDLSSLSNVKTIGNGFLSGCGLTRIDLSSLSSVETIGNNFLEGCHGLTDIYCTEEKFELIKNALTSWQKSKLKIKLK